MQKENQVVAAAAFLALCASVLLPGALCHPSAEFPLIQNAIVNYVFFATLLCVACRLFACHHVVYLLVIMSPLLHRACCLSNTA